MIFLISLLISLNAGAGDIVVLNYNDVVDTIRVDNYGNLNSAYFHIENVNNISYEKIRDSIYHIVTSLYPESNVSVKCLKVVYLLGEVKHPGMYYLNPFARFTELLSRAGGFSNSASKNSCVLLRHDKKINVKAKNILEGKRPDIVLQSGDIVYIKRSFWEKFKVMYPVASTISLLVTLYLSLRTVK